MNFLQLVYVFLIAIINRLDCLVIKQEWQKCSPYWLKSCSEFCLTSQSQINKCLINSKWFREFRGNALSSYDWEIYFKISCEKYIPNKCEDRSSKEENDFFSRPRHLYPKFGRKNMQISDDSLSNLSDKFSDKFNFNKSQKFNFIFSNTHNSKHVKNKEDDNIRLWIWDKYVSCKCEK
jgi:hypothetical protein